MKPLEALNPIEDLKLSEECLSVLHNAGITNVHELTVAIEDKTLLLNVDCWVELFHALDDFSGGEYLI
jgi:DNA-directed RNA polymerase alpha subunit